MRRRAVQGVRPARRGQAVDPAGARAGRELGGAEHRPQARLPDARDRHGQLWQVVPRPVRDDAGARHAALRRWELPRLAHGQAHAHALQVVRAAADRSDRAADQAAGRAGGAARGGRRVGGGDARGGRAASGRGQRLRRGARHAHVLRGGGGGGDERHGAQGPARRDGARRRDGRRRAAHELLGRGVRGHGRKAAAEVAGLRPRRHHARSDGRAVDGAAGEVTPPPPLPHPRSSPAARPRFLAASCAPFLLPPCTPNTLHPQQLSTLPRCCSRRGCPCATPSCCAS